MNKIRIGILFGGKSAEHEISLLSARNIVEALDPEKYEITLIGIDKQGHWHLCKEAPWLPHARDPQMIEMGRLSHPVSLVPRENRPHLVSLQSQDGERPLDVVFPVLHGTYGEDGTVQGLFKLAGIPFVGASVLGSAIGMDKDVMKRLLRDGGIPVAKFVTLRHCDMHSASFTDIVREVGLPFFVKPANAGSSVGISKVKSELDWQKALEGAFLYDRKILIEEYIEGREIECSVLGNEHPIVSLPGELIPQHEFYSYEAKYLDEQGALFEIPAKLDVVVVEKIQRLAVDAYLTLCCEGMARVDFFLQKDGRLHVNEINTIPGFTKISMYPKLWEVSGMSQRQLLDRLIDLAMARHHSETHLSSSI